MELGTHQGAVPSPEAADTGGIGFSVRCWGTRGSVPSPGADTVRYGGNTPCVEVQAAGERIILDAGTGIRLLGRRLLEERATRSARIFLTHFHWDHIQGFPFFDPVYDPDFTVRIVGPAQEGLSAEELFAGQMGPIYFPIPYGALSASLVFDHLEEGTWREGGVRLRTMRMRHPSSTVGYRVEAGGHSVVFIPDNELIGGAHPTPPRWRENLEAFVEGADLLLHDAMYTTEEYATREGWGHSTFDQALELAERAGVKRLSFFHHAPERSDRALDRILAGILTRLRERGSPLEVEAASEGRTLHLTAR